MACEDYPVWAVLSGGSLSDWIGLNWIELNWIGFEGDWTKVCSDNILGESSDVGCRRM
jgi:hypothetical protein